MWTIRWNPFCIFCMCGSFHACEFENASSIHSIGRKLSGIWNRRRASLNCGFFRVKLNCWKWKILYCNIDRCTAFHLAMEEKCWKITKEAKNGSDMGKAVLPLCFLLCFSRSCNCRQRWSHIVQLNGYKINSELICWGTIKGSLNKVSLRTEELQKLWTLLTLSSLCIRMWTLKLPPCVNPLWQILQRCVKLCEWVFMWRDNFIDVGNTLPHVEHDLQSVLLLTRICEALWVKLMSSSGLTSFLIVASMPLVLLTIGWIGTVETTE